MTEHFRATELVAKCPMCQHSLKVGFAPPLLTESIYLSIAFVTSIGQKLCFFDKDGLFLMLRSKESCTGDALAHRCSPTWKPEESSSTPTKFSLKVDFEIPSTKGLQVHWKMILEALTSAAQNKLENLFTGSWGSQKLKITEAILSVQEPEKRVPGRKFSLVLSQQQTTKSTS